VIEEVTVNNLDEVLPLIKEYQAFYGVEDIDEEQTRLFFSQFAKRSDNGILHLYRFKGKAIGFSTIYKGFSSTRVEAVAVLNDLYIQPFYRGNGFAKELIKHALEMAKSLGYSRIQWMTAEDNITAQRFYNSFAANRSSWLFYAKET
jgi:GNAT superfamily N-acetyltransferase